MPDTGWMKAVERWRSLPPEERRRRHLEAIPRHVANSMAMEGEPVDEAWIRERLARRIRPPGYIETSAGILSYQELAPLLAERVAGTELAISDRTFAALSFYDLLLDLHRCICAGLTPEIAGRWRLRDVRVGEHQPPPHWQVPMLMRNYAADLEARLADQGGDSGERLIDDLAFAEGRLLHVHPFEDFNGRVSRLFVIELLYRLDLPVIDPATSSPEETSHYFAALRAYDRYESAPPVRHLATPLHAGDSSMIHVHRLDGCTPTPLAHYLKALGILRLVAEQADRDVRGWWNGDRFRLATKLSRGELDAFFLNDYRPTPLVSPWNKGSGFFFEKDPAVFPLEQSKSRRFLGLPRRYQSEPSADRRARTGGWRGTEYQERSQTTKQE